eukprot:scaffold4733_cov170-Alexandrium_tamarense.AAC.64
MYKGKILLLLFSVTVAITEANDEEYVISKNRDIHPLLRDPHRDSNNIKGYLSKIKILWQRDVVGDIPSHSVPSSDESEEVDDTVSNSVDQQEGRHLNRVWHQDQGRKHNKTKKVGTKKSRPKRKPGNIFNLANNHKKNKNKGKKHSKPKHGKSSKSSSSSKSSKNSGKSSTSKTNKAMTTTTTTIPIPYDCDDKDPCTTDMRIDGMCVYTPVDCREDESCYPETGECLPDEELVPCVAVIDEDSNHIENDNDWMEFRSIYKYRPFCLLSPPNPNPSEVVAIPPAAATDPNFQMHNVISDKGDQSPDDWFTLCGLNKLGSANIEYVGLFVDGSFSLGKPKVKNSYNKFIEDAQVAGLTLCEVYNDNERWVEPFISDLTPNSGTCDHPVPLT